jgi:hypothetical protein
MSQPTFKNHTLKKHVVYGALLSTALLCSPLVYADNPNYRGNQDGYDTFAGLGYKQYWVSPKTEWKPVLRGNTSGFAFLVGQRVHDYFAVELGYEWTTDKPKTVSVANGSSLLGVPTAADVNIQSKLRFKTGYADLQLLMPFKLTETFNPELIVALGVGTMKPSIRFSSDPATTSAFTNAFTTFKGKSKTVGRIGLGLQSFLTESIGVRVIWRFENTATLRGSNSVIAQNPATRTLFKNGQSAFVGLVMRL